MNGFAMIPDWRNKNLRCHFCDETRSVKYTMKIFDPVIDNKPTEVYVCNKCALRYMVSKSDTLSVI